MSELCGSKLHFYSIVISDLIMHLCSVILSHPLYLSYFIFFSPYIVKLISFLSPLFITTLILLLAFLSETFSSELSQNRVIHLKTSFLEKLSCTKDDLDAELQCFEDLGMYEILFGPSTMMQIKENTVIIFGNSEEDFTISSAEKEFAAETTQIPDSKSENPYKDERRLENFLKILGEFERMAANSGVKEGKTMEPTTGAKADKVVSLLRNGSEAKGDNYNNNNNKKILNVATKVGGKDCNSIDRAQSQRINSNNVVDELKVARSYGSVRKEREWKRTLACKLFEERHNVDGGEGMDSLWEAYEMDLSNKTITNQKTKMKMKMKTKTKSNVDYDDDEDDDEIAGGGGGQLCCLQALNLSARRKMNLGIGKPNLVKISKAIRGIGWLHHTSSKSSKKVHNNGDR